MVARERASEGDFGADAMSKWQDIKTAPRDGTSILLVGQSENADIPQTGFWFNSAVGGWWALDDGENCFVYGPQGPIKIYGPKKWQPLPEPPA